MPVGTSFRTLVSSSAAAVAAFLVLGVTAPAAAAVPGAATGITAGTALTSAQLQGQQLTGKAERRAERRAARKAARKAAQKKRVNKMLRIVRNQKGDPYSYGAAGPNRFDCSGLVYYSTHKAGFRNVPRTSSQQGRFMRRIGRAAMRPGDFVFFTGGSGVYHVGVYTGRSGGRRIIIHAPGSGQRVTTAAIWTDRWFAGTLR